MDDVKTLKMDQVMDITAKIQSYLFDLDPTWDISANEMEWEITENEHYLCSFPLIPTAKDLSQIVADGASAAPEELAPVWRKHLSSLARRAIPHAFHTAGVPIREEA